MPQIALWAGAGALAYFGFKAVDDAASSTGNLVKWAAIGGAGLLAVQAAKKAKLI